MIDRKEGMLKVHLDIDTEQEPEQAYWYPYTPMTGNIMYSVPELGTRVLLNIASEREEDAQVSCCVRAESTVSLPVGTKTMWTDGANYTATPDYMGFDCENAGSLADAFVLDDEVGLVAYGKKRIQIRAKGTITLGSRGNISLSGVTETKLAHPKAKEEQAWIAMDCGRMRLGGSFIAHSGMMAGSDIGGLEDSVDSFYLAVAEALSMIPIAAKAETLQGLEAEAELYSSLAGVVSYGAETGTVTQTQGSVDSTEEVEKKATIYVGGYLCKGEVRGGKTK